MRPGDIPDRRNRGPIDFPSGSFALRKQGSIGWVAELVQRAFALHTSIVRRGTEIVRKKAPFHLRLIGTAT